MTAADGAALSHFSRSEAGAWRVIRYGVLGWMTDTGGVSEASVFPYHRASTTVVLYWAVLASAVVEVPVLHLLVRHWNHRLAWIATALGTVAIIYVAALIKGMYLRPVVLTDSHLLVRLGIQRELCIPLEDIVSIGSAGAEVAGVIRMCAADAPNIRVAFSRGGKGGFVDFFVSEPKRLQTDHAARRGRAVSLPPVGR